jgi:hypothetical protein
MRSTWRISLRKWPAAAFVVATGASIFFTSGRASGQDEPWESSSPAGGTSPASNAPSKSASDGDTESSNRQPAWQPGDPVPVGYHPVERRHPGLIIAGSLTFGHLYLLSALLGGFGDLNGVNGDAMFIPVAGPLIQMAQPGVANDADLIFVLDSVGQAAGIAMLVAGLTWRTTVLVRDDTGPPVVVVRPYVAPHLAGIQWVGTF